MPFQSDLKACGFSRAWGGGETPVQVWQDLAGGALGLHFYSISWLLARDFLSPKGNLSFALAPPVFYQTGK